MSSVLSAPTTPTLIKTCTTTSVSTTSSSRPDSRSVMLRRMALAMMATLPAAGILRTAAVVRLSQAAGIPMLLLPPLATGTLATPLLPLVAGTPALLLLVLVPGTTPMLVMQLVLA